MMKKLAARKLVRHTPYRGVELTASGEKIALEIIRHHRLIETYLAEILGMDWDKVHDEAERWEHVLGEEAEARIAAAWKSSTDPHGAPIIRFWMVNFRFPMKNRSARRNRANFW